jgi:hypothetical protein
LLCTIPLADIAGAGGIAIGSAALAAGLLPAFLSVHSQPDAPEADESAVPLSAGPDQSASITGEEEVALAQRRAAYRRGLVVFIGLAILTAVEFSLALATESIVFLFVLGLAKAGLIVQYYMHAGKLWEGEETHG